MSDRAKAHAISNDLRYLYQRITEAKPGNRSDVDRRYAIVLTDLEKLIAYFRVYIVREENP